MKENKTCGTSEKGSKLPYTPSSTVLLSQQVKSSL